MSTRQLVASPPPTVVSVPPPNLFRVERLCPYPRRTTDRCARRRPCAPAAHLLRRRDRRARRAVGGHLRQLGGENRQPPPERPLGRTRRPGSPAATCALADRCLADRLFLAGVVAAPGADPATADLVVSGPESLEAARACAGERVALALRPLGARFPQTPDGSSTTPSRCLARATTSSRTRPSTRRRPRSRSPTVASSLAPRSSSVLGAAPRHWGSGRERGCCRVFRSTAGTAWPQACSHPSPRAGPSCSALIWTGSLPTS